MLFVVFAKSWSGSGIGIVNVHYRDINLMSVSLANLFLVH